MTGRFTGRTAVITGAATGIGAACARRLASEGAAVVIADIDAEGGRRAAGEITAEGGRALFAECDAGSADDWTRLAESTMDAFGRVDVLVGNAYALAQAPAHLLPEADWDRVLSVTLKALYLGVRAFAEPLLAAHGAVVAVSSVHAYASRPGFAAYAAAKGGVNALVRQLAVEYAPGLRVNAVAPGPVRTRQWDRVPEDAIAVERDRTPAGRLGEPAEIAAAVAFLASDEASFITGACLPVDGGWAVHHR